MNTLASDDMTGGASPGGWPRGLWVILLLGLVVRLAVVGWMHTHGQQLEIGDAKSYNTIAVQLATRGEFATAAGRPTSLRPPLYPAFLAAVYRVTGVENFDAVRLAQAALGLLLTIEVYYLARGMYSQRVALWAAGICCFYPSLVAYGAVLLTEVLFATLVVAACLALQRYYRRPSYVQLAALGLFLALGALTRSVLWLFIPLLGLYLLVTTAPLSWPRRIGAAAVTVATCLAVLAPWAIRNTRLQETLTVIDCMGGRNVMMGNYEHTPLDRPWDAVSMRGEKSWYSVLTRDMPRPLTITQGQLDKLAMRYGLNYMVTHPVQTLQRSVVKFFNFWQLERSFVAGAARGWWGNPSTATVVGLMALFFSSYVLAITAGVFGFCVLPPDERRLYWFVLLLVGFVCAVHTAIFSHSRYHVALMPLVFPFAGAALAQLPEVWRNRKQPAFWVAGSVCALLAAGWLYEIVVVDWEKFRSQILA